MSQLINEFGLKNLLNYWVLFGFFGQFLFFVRFLVQWWASEKQQKITIPMSFWYLSIIGTAIVLLYSIHIHDIVFTSAQILSFAIYFRNIALHKPEEKVLAQMQTAKS